MQIDDIVDIYQCNTEYDLIECQKYFIKKGYFWYGKRINNDESIPYFTNEEFGDRVIPNIYEPLLIILYKNFWFGWNVLNHKRKYNLPIKIFNIREKKLERICDE